MPMELFANELAAEIARDENVPPDHIYGVRCDVTSCAYHDGERFCTARDIAVGSHTASKKEETFCRTFVEREMHAAN